MNSKKTKAAGEVLTAKQAPHRPGTAPALGLRAGKVAVTIISQTPFRKDTVIMWYDSMLDFLKFGPARTRAGRTRSVVPRKWRATCKLHLELLEDRTLPSTLTVLNTDDNGDGSLRAVLAAAQPDDTIRFDHQLCGQTITLTSGELVIDKSLDIEGPGANRLTVSGDDAGRVFDITVSGARVAITGLTIGHGLATHGGGIDNSGTLTVADLADALSTDVPITVNP